jgi:hypothetical protein
MTRPQATLTLQDYREAEQFEFLECANEPCSGCSRCLVRRLLANATELQQRYDDIVDIDIARQQLPDGTVPGNTVECARGWKRAYDDLRKHVVTLERDSRHEAGELHAEISLLLDYARELRAMLPQVKEAE